ncbi:PREDICTED: heat shock protein 75 kDa, mitochondrial [Hipposideros armiger]|uniref:Heat shock protein 75 kDa, mitochondrial n=1 Tax=Hipposideros armiger TaxID=186990 RepID=A0A8B7SUA7_HIPAR|nr:PREDICTED: heat shock protein 75 kDa, mitochondrial [Hipposideros armiger]
MARELRALLLWGRRLRAPALAVASGGKPALCPWRAPVQSRSPRQNLASSFHIGRPFSSQAAEDREEASLHSIISSTETVQGSVSKHEFQAETKKLLDIVARSLYSEKEVRYLLITRSTSRAFLDALQSQAEASSKIIGQFGVGFYSAFMVADRVEVYSRSAGPDSPGYQWLSDGSGVFEIAEASGVRTGTKIIMHLKSDCKEFASEARVRDVVTKYSNFVSFPLYLNGKRINTLQAVWMMDPKDVGEWQHEEFYRYIAQAHDKPRYTLHYKTDAPLNIRSIFYVPEMEGGPGTSNDLPFVCLQEDIAKLLRYESSALPAGQLTSLMDYASRMQAGTRNIYYLCTPNRHLAEHSPYYEAMKQKNMEVLFCYEQFDELTLLHLREFDKKKLISVETDIVIDHYKEEKFEDGSAGRVLETCVLVPCHLGGFTPAQDSLTPGPRFCSQVTLRLDTHPAMITVLEMGAARHFLRMQQLAKTQEERAQLLQPTLEINPRHTLIKKLSQLRESEPDLAQLLIDQIYENAMIAAGLVDDPRAMVGRLNNLLVKALERH